MPAFLMTPRQRTIFVLLTVAGVVARVILTLVADNKMLTPWRVGGDAPYYVRLASTVFQGMGYTYGHQPTAFRPPLYPFFLAGMMTVFGTYFAEATRFLQCAVGLVTVWLCGAMATRFFGGGAGRMTLLLALYFPTLSIFPTELITECFATFLTAAFFWLALENPHVSEGRTALCLGLVVGFAALLRPNMAIFGPIAAWIVVGKGRLRTTWQSVGVLALVAGAIVAPWTIRNEVVFHGQALFSTQGGYNALQGVLTPQGRVQEGDDETLRKAGVWERRNLETNGPQRLMLPSEPELDRRAWQLTQGIWREKTWRLIPLLVAKLGYFWLSTDQLSSVNSFPWRSRVTRGAGVVLYWILLGLAIVGWIQLRQHRPDVAKFLIAYAVLITAAHLPFIMTSRHRIPFAEPLLVVLGGAGCVRLWKRLRIQLPSSLDSEVEARAN